MDMSGLRVVAAMSGGVDSAVAAARMKDLGHDVVGVHLALSKNPETGLEHGRGCCTLSDARDARRSADIIGIPFYIWDMAEEFSETVMADFVAEYQAGRTPNPCVRCNERIKFAAVLDRALDLGFDAVCTGHYARRVNRGDGTYDLCRARDADKDQSYVLSVLTQEQLSRARFPLGDDLKSDVRVDADQRGLYVANKPDSYDICFIPDGDTAGWLRDRVGARTGDIVDIESGAKLGEHEGSFAYTVGQRRGLGVKIAPADGRPRYVVDVDTASNTVFLGPPQLLEIDTIEALNAVWLNGIPARGASVEVQVRAHGQTSAARVLAASGSDVSVGLETRLRGVAAGQTLALYREDRVLGSATIARTRVQRPH